MVEKEGRKYIFLSDIVLLQTGKYEKFLHFTFLILANENTILEAEVRTLQRKLARRDNEILKQERELHKLRVGIPSFKK